MGNKKIKNLFTWLRREQSYNKDQKIPDHSTVELGDLKHDLENQIIKIQQELENLRSKTYSSNRSLYDSYKELCNEYSENVAKSLIFIDRLTYQMFCEMACVTILDGKSEKIDEHRIKHKITLHKILLRILLLYWEELWKSHVRYELIPSNIEWEVSEYVFSAIILKIIQNCSKYCKPSSVLVIKIDTHKITFKMNSLKIEYTEKLKIFDNNASGKNAVRAWKNWSGKWLYHAKKLAEFHGLELYVNPGVNPSQYEWNDYADNEFILELK